MPKQWDSYQYRMAEHYLPVMINGDSSGMEDADIAEYQAFEQQAYANAEADGFTVGHWSTVDDSGDDWGICEVSGLLAMRCTVDLLVYKEF